jgi:hypothetical protein
MDIRNRKDGVTRVYLGGPMTGKPRYNWDAFTQTAADLRSVGYEVYSPHEYDEQMGFNPDTDTATPEFVQGAMRWDLAQIAANVDIVIFLPGWRDSVGSQIEYRTAKACGRPIYEWDNWTLKPVVEEAKEQPVYETAVQEAQRLVHGNRGADYGHPIDDFTRTGRMWAAILGLDEVTAEQVALCMVAVKISRECNKPKRDNRVDICGYAETLEMVRRFKETGER